MQRSKLFVLRQNELRVAEPLLRRLEMKNTSSSSDACSRSTGPASDHQRREQSDRNKCLSTHPGAGWFSYLCTNIGPLETGIIGSPTRALGTHEWTNTV